MQQSDSIKELAKALCNVQSQLEGAKKDQTNPFFKAKYADLASVWGACRDLLGKNDLSVVQTTSVIEGREFVLDTTLLHTSGEWISGQLSVPLVKNDPQGLGSAFTYARRYALSAIVGICPEDDDAENATQRQKETPKPQEKPKLKETIIGHVDLIWLKESLGKLQKAGLNEWSNANTLKHIENKYQVVGKSLSIVVPNLTEKQGAAFSLEVATALTSLGVKKVNEEITDTEGKQEAS